MGCCVIDPFQHFDVIVVGADELGIATVMQLCSYGVKTALIDQKSLTENVLDLFRQYESYIETELGMPQSLQEIEDDMHLKLFEGIVKIGENQSVFIDDKEIFGENLIIQCSIDKTVWLNNKLLKEVSKGYWVRETVAQNKERTWLLAEMMTKKFVYHQPLDYL